jgi:hypothetical protein
VSEMTITELRRTGSAVSPTLTVFRWTSATHSSGQGTLTLALRVNTRRRLPAGASEPVEQVIGSEWEPFDVQGEWSDKWAGAGFASRIKREFAQFVARAPLVRFQLDEESIVGLITNLQITYSTRDRAGYQFKMSPHLNEGVGDPRATLGRVPAQPINVRVDAANDALVALIDVAEDVADLPTKSFDVSDSIKQLDELADAVARANTFTDSGVSQDATHTLLVMATTFRRVQGAAQTIMLDVGRRRSDLAVAYDDAISILRFDEWSKETLRQAAVTIGVSRQAEQDMRARAARKPRAVHRASAGEPLERISLRYYGTADNWKMIFDANQLDSVLLEGGEELLIPEVTA